MNQTFEIHDSPSHDESRKGVDALLSSVSFVFGSLKAETEPSEKSLINESHHGNIFGYDRAPRLGGYPKS
jgi:hypothetical protein